MGDGFLSDVEARAHRRRTDTQDDSQADLATDAWRAARQATGADRLRWLERAHRLAPKDGMVAVTLASARLEAGDPHGATILFRAEAARHGALEAWSGLAAALLVLTDLNGARDALQSLLRRHAPNAAVRALADRIAPGGWIGLSHRGAVLAGTGRGALALDNAPIPARWARGTAALPDGWRRAAEVSMAGALGSPVPVRGFAGLEGFVAAVAGGIEGWAHCPADAAAIPVIRIEGAGGAIDLAATEPAGIRLADPFARPRRFRLDAAQAAALAGTLDGGLGEALSVRGPDGRHLSGSPLDPGMERRPGFAPVWADTVGPAPARMPARRSASVVIPVYGGAAVTLACIDSVLAAQERGDQVVVVDDASPDAALRTALDALARQRRIRLVRLAENRGFPGAANAGIAAAAGRDVVLLNSDTLVPPGWLARLRHAAYAAPDIGTVTPLTNDGTIVSYPDPHGPNPVPDLAAALALDRLAQANDPAPIDLPVGVGFCLYLRRDCLDRIGALRDDVFAQGYGEENDLCLRARHAGFRNVASPAVFVAHVGATSFGAAREWLVRRNTEILERLHPGYRALVAAHVAADPLRAVRAAMDAARWAAGRQGRAAVLVTHGGGGGVERRVQERAAAIAAAGGRAILVRPARTGSGGPAARIEEPGRPYPNLVFAMPKDLPALVRLLRRDRVERVEVHHTLGHHAAITGLAGLLRAEAVSVVHDYARFCGRIALVGPGQRYCGEPDVAGCEACLADLGSLLEDDPPVPALLARSGAELAAAARVVAPSQDAARRIRRHFPHVRAEVDPWEDDQALAPISAPTPGARLRVAVVGAIGIEKGFDVLLACVRDAQARALPIEFVVVGYTMDDRRLARSGPAFVTGVFAESEAAALIRAQKADLAFIPSIFPETWCFALTRAWQAGLPAVVFDLGAQAERVRARSAGWVIPPGLPSSGINDALLRVAPAKPPRHSPPRAGTQKR